MSVKELFEDVLLKELRGSILCAKFKLDLYEEMKNTVSADYKVNNDLKEAIQLVCSVNNIEEENSFLQQIEALRNEIEQLRRKVPINGAEQILDAKSAIKDISENAGERKTFPTSLSARAIDDLVSEFDGRENSFWMWKRQVKLLGTMCDLNTKTVRLFIYSKLKGRAAKWFYSKSKHFTLNIDTLLKEMKRVFDQPSNLLSLKAKIWSSDEDILNFIHENLILANESPFTGMKRRDDLLLVFRKTNRNEFDCDKKRRINSDKQHPNIKILFFLLLLLLLTSLYFIHILLK
jgi:hypothetical protein